MIRRPVEILLVEDSPGDVWLTREALMRGSVPKKIHVVTNGEQAIDFLRRRDSFAAAPRPDLVLLDINLPRRDGFEVLREIKTDPALKTITVIVLTTSEAGMDVNMAYDLNANCYVVKPADLERFTATIQGIESFWMGMASLPSSAPPPGTTEAKGNSGNTSGNGESQSSSGSNSKTARRSRLISRLRRSALIRVRTGRGRKLRAQGRLV